MRILTTEELRVFAESSASEFGAHLVELVLRGEGHRKVIEIFVDAEQGVTTDLCAEISRSFGKKLDDRDPVGGSYKLIVSSPGIDRPMRFTWQYRKHVGRQMKILVKREGGTESVTGKLLSVDESGIVLEEKKEKTATPISFSSVVEARVHLPW